MCDEQVAIELNFTTVAFTGSSFVSNGCRWEAETLVKAAQGLPVFEIPLAGIDLGVMPWQVANIWVIAEHFNRVIKADLKYPVILDEFGYIADGWHRVVKALLLKKTHIKAIRLPEMPKPDEIFETKTKNNKHF